MKKAVELIVEFREGPTVTVWGIREFDPILHSHVADLIKGNKKCYPNTAIS